MIKSPVIEGNREELCAHAAEFAGKRLRLTVLPDAPTALELAIDAMQNRTEEELRATRERILRSSPPPRELPEGKTLLDVVMGKWPGDETDEEIFAALKKLS